MNQFFLLFKERPISYNNKKTKSAYEQRLGDFAKIEAEKQGFYWAKDDNVKLYAQVYYFHKGKRDIDTDNLSKPVIDSLCKIVYEDDSLISVRRAVKVDLRDSEGYSLTLSSGLPTEWIEKLLNAIGKWEDFLFIEIGELEKIPVFFGRATDE